MRVRVLPGATHAAVVQRTGHWYAKPEIEVQLLVVASRLAHVSVAEWKRRPSPKRVFAGSIPARGISQLTRRHRPTDRTPVSESGNRGSSPRGGMQPLSSAGTSACPTNRRSPVRPRQRLSRKRPRGQHHTPPSSNGEDTGLRNQRPRFESSWWQRPLSSAGTSACPTSRRSPVRSRQRLFRAP